MTLMPVDKVNPCCKFPLDPVMIVTLVSVSVGMMTGRGGELVPPPHHPPYSSLSSLTPERSHLNKFCKVRNIQKLIIFWIVYKHYKSNCVTKTIINYYLVESYY